MTAQLRDWTEHGIPRVKIKIGEDWGGAVERDLARVRRARDVVGAGVELYVDANGAYQRKQAMRVGRALEDADVRWFEEPVSSDDKDGLAVLRDGLDIDVTAGEYATDLYELRRLCGVVDCLQVDASRCGGVTGWMNAAALAASYGLEVSAHCAPHLHLAAVAATPNLRHVEYFHDHVRIEQRYLDGSVTAEDGAMPADSSAPGHGFELREQDLAEFRVA
jgi:L-alanine-DL-glutamate epimerase-like enolase superfamily enzyme